MPCSIASASSFNADLSNVDVSSVTNMDLMFAEASSFNADLSKWDVSSVTNTAAMFGQATSFNSDLSKCGPSADMFSRPNYSGNTTAPIT